MAECQYIAECSERDSILDKLEFCLNDLDRGSFRGCPFGFVKNGDVVYSPMMKL